MKPVLAWIKSNLFIVIFAAIIILVLPTAFVVSGMWTKGLRTREQTAADKRVKEVQGLNVEYTLPAYEPGGQPVAVKSPPNASLTEWFKRERERLDKQAGAVVKRAEDFNQGIGPDAQALGRLPHSLLVEGLFPAAGSKDQETDLLNEMEDKLLGKRGNPNPYQALLDASRAGGPADPVRLKEVLTDVRVREAEKQAAKRELTADEQAALSKQLAGRRLSEYMARAREVSFYATIDAFPRTGDGVSLIPYGSIPSIFLEPVPFYIYQWDYWVYADLLAAIRVANAPPGQPRGTPVNVDQAVVKRIEKMSITDPEGVFGNTPDAMAEGTESVAPSSPVPGMVPLDPTISITGRGMGTWNTVYDVRRASMTLILASARIQEFIDAVERTNFMTVTALDLAEVDPWAELRQGYYYGPDHVVRATVEIETIWLRSWTAKLMPKALRDVLGVPEAPAPTEGEADPDPA